MPMDTVRLRVYMGVYLCGCGAVGARICEVVPLLRTMRFEDRWVPRMADAPP